MVEIVEVVVPLNLLLNDLARLNHGLIVAVLAGNLVGSGAPLDELGREHL